MKKKYLYNVKVFLYILLTTNCFATQLPTHFDTWNDQANLFGDFYMPSFKIHGQFPDAGVCDDVSKYPTANVGMGGNFIWSEFKYFDNVSPLDKTFLFGSVNFINSDDETMAPYFNLEFGAGYKITKEIIVNLRLQNISDAFVYTKMSSAGISYSPNQAIKLGDFKINGTGEFDYYPQKQYDPDAGLYGWYMSDHLLAQYVADLSLTVKNKKISNDLYFKIRSFVMFGSQQYRKPTMEEYKYDPFSNFDSIGINWQFSLNYDFTKNWTGKVIFAPYQNLGGSTTSVNKTNWGALELNYKI